MGGGTANSLAEIPSKITELTSKLTNFAKINNAASTSTSNFKNTIDLEVNCNLKFIPKIIIYDLYIHEGEYLGKAKSETFVYYTNTSKILGSVHIYHSYANNRTASVSVKQISVNNNKIIFKIKPNSTEPSEIDISIDNLILIEIP